MATALQQQLAAIAANSTHQLDLKAQKTRHSKSLLFEPRIAASQNFDSIYQICLDGFEELCQLDARFLTFAKTLFSEQSKNEDRSQMTAAENRDLDAVIDRFLGLLGGRLLLKPAVKAAEWLIRRFRTHEHNTEAMLFTFLPYHASPIFPVLLSILPEELPSNFRFLHPYVASRQSPPRHVIVAAASNQSAFFTTFSHRVLEVAKLKYQSALLIGFWASVTAQAVNGMVDSTRSGREAIRRQREEDLLLRVLPVLQMALGIQGVAELYLATCMIITILATRLPLEEKVLNAMLEAIAGGWTSHTIEDGITCLAVVAEEKQSPSLTEPVTRAVLKVEEAPAILARVALLCRTDKLLVGLCSGATSMIRQHKSDNASPFLAKLLASDVLAETQKALVIARLDDALKATDPKRRIEKSENGKALLSIVRAAKDRADPKMKKLLDKEATKVETSERAMRKPETVAFDAASLPKLPSDKHSFLAHQSLELSTEFVSRFKQISSTPADVNKFLSAPQLDREGSATSPKFLTFLAHVWCTDGAIDPRTSALENAEAEIDKFLRHDKSNLDLQGLLPYCVSALADDEQAVRVAAASLCMHLSELVEKNSSRAKSGQTGHVWAKESIYGPSSSKLTWLSNADHQAFFVSVLNPMLDDCIIDGSYLTRGLADVLDASSHGHAGKTLKSVTRTNFVNFLAHHACESAVMPCKLKILGVLQNVGKIAGPARVDILLPYVQDVLKRPDATSTRAEKVTLLRSLLSNVTARSSEEIEFLKSLAVDQPELVETSGMGFNRIREIWPNFKDAAQNELADWLLDLCLQDGLNDEVQTEALATIQDVPLSSAVLVHLTESIPAASDIQDQPPSAKKLRLSRNSELAKSNVAAADKLNIAIRKMTLVLDIVENSTPGDHPKLLRGLFYMLSELHHYKTLVGSELAYLQGSLMSSLLSVVDSIRQSSDTNIDRSIVRADLIVECVRTTSSTQVHHAALLLMSSLASWAPDLVLHSVMPLFTFMSSTILKQGDDYSAHVTDQTVARIIPPLAASLKKSGKDLISGAADLLLSFTAAFEHIPIHRRSGLFKHLVDKLGAEESLFAIVALLIDRYPDEPSLPMFISELMNGFPNVVQLQATKQYLDLVSDSLRSKRGLSDQILMFNEKSRAEAKLATSVLLKGLAEVVSLNTLQKSLAKELKIGGSQAEELRVLYSEVLEKAMQLTLQLKDDTVIRPSSDQLLSALLSLMPTNDFIEASAKLMQGGTDEIRQQVFRSLEKRAGLAKRGDASMQQVFIDVLPNCIWFITEAQSEQTRHAAIACIDQIAEKFGKTDKEAVLEAAQHISGKAALQSDSNDLRVISTLCLATMVEVLEEEFLPIAPTALNKTLEYLQQMTTKGTVDPSLFNAIFALLENLLDHTELVLSGKYLDTVLALSCRSLAFGEAQAAVVQQFCDRAAKKLAPSYCLATLVNTWAAAVDFGFPSLQLLVGMLQRLVKHHSKSNVTENIEPIFTLLQSSFDIRSLHEASDSSTEDEDDLAQMDVLVNSAAMSVVLKLNDATFRPFYNSLIEWAMTPTLRKHRARTVARCTSVYSFTFTLFEQLKSLVTSYAGSLLTNARELLESLDVSITNEANLVDLVTQALASSFRHDQDGYWQSPAHFDAIAKPLLAQLAHSEVHAAEDHAIPAIRDLAAAAISPDHYRAMNTVIMSYMRHEDSEVRLAAVKCERAITEKLNIDWLTMLPEMLPVINELQEDDDGQVERETLRWMKQMEDITGQSIQDMLR
jgi:U3 small nucleolar RNA-associated protein 10